jgi:hypothetical protein
VSAAASAASLHGISVAPRADLDIFPKLAAFLDPHLVIPVLEHFYRSLGIYEEKDVLQAKLDLALRCVARGRRPRGSRARPACCVRLPARAVLLRVRSRFLGGQSP